VTASRVAFVFGVVAFAVVPAVGAQDDEGTAPGRGAPTARNLQVLPKDTPPQNVMATMQAFTRALGVQCTFCHVQGAVEMLTPEEAAAQAAQPGAGRGRGRGRQSGPPMDFAADTKRQKQTARLMLRMVNDINRSLAAGLRKPESEITRVQCVTCHRGVTNPELLPDLLARTMLGKGEGAATALYRELRQKYPGTDAYDFNENVLVELARQSLASRKPDDALAWLLLNVEFYPKSSASYLVLSQAHLVKNDREAAVKDLESALAVDPNNQQAWRELEKLKKQP